MKISHCGIDGVLHLSPTQHRDTRGFFTETYNKDVFDNLTGLSVTFVQDNRSTSTKSHTIRGLHFQGPPHAQGKLVRCGRGAIFDVAVDIRRGSPTYGNWEGYELTAENDNQLYVPIGFAHGFMTLEPDSEIVYKCTDYYAPGTEGAIKWASCGIEWPLCTEPVLSDKDALAPSLADFDSPFIYGENS